MDYLPVFMDLRGREAVIVGGGVVASRKAALVAKAGACLTIVSAALSPAMRTLLRDERHRWIARNFDDSDVAAADLVIAATDDGGINRRVYEAASRWRIPVNVVDAPAQCSFILPAIVDRSPAIIAVSTGGRSPVLARHVKALLERLLPARLGRLAAFCGRLRRRVAAAVPEPAARRRFWESQLEGHVPELVYAGRSRDAEAAIAAELEACDADRAPRGEVYLIGAGPGDPELLTLKAQRLLQRADVVLYDRLVPVGVLEMCRREAEAVYVGKRCGDHPVPQQEISAMLVDYAQQGKRVARLKGGDPFVFGRGGEELEALAEAGIDFQVVPGVSSANGAAAYAGIPLTHRDHAQSVSFWTGHMKDGELDLDWPAMCAARQTLVFFMGSTNAGAISRNLIDNGMPPTTPAAVVQGATTPRQSVQRTSLRRLGDTTAALDRSLPTLIIVGSVVNLSTQLGWFEGNEAEGAAVFPPHLQDDGVVSGYGVA